MVWWGWAAVAFIALEISGMHQSRADELDDWCSKVTKASNIVICADPELRGLAMSRNRLFADAQQNLSGDAYKLLLDDQNRWVRSYTAACGVPLDGPAPTSPIPRGVIECYKHAGQDRVVYLTNYLGRQIAGYHAPVPSPDEVERTEREKAARAEAQRQVEIARQERERREAAERAERDRQEQTAAEEARKQLRRQAAAEQEQRISAKLQEKGFTLISPVDLDLDWREHVARNDKIAIRGVYADVNDVEGLSVPNKDLPLIRLYTDSASRDGRKAMLECRNSDFNLSMCRMVIGATVQGCVRNKDKLNEKPIPCLQVIEAFVLPNDAQ